MRGRLVTWSATYEYLVKIAVYIIEKLPIFDARVRPLYLDVVFTRQLGIHVRRRKIGGSEPLFRKKKKSHMAKVVTSENQNKDALIYGFHLIHDVAAEIRVLPSF